jgi:DNA ligase-1
MSGIEFDRLYKRTAKGDVQVWDLEFEDATGRYRTHSGKEGGKLVTSEWTVPKPKNAGRSNATTVVEQGAIEARAAWAKKMRDGYRETADDAQSSDRFECMVPVKYSDALPKKRALEAMRRGELYEQAKLDGIRCIASKAGLISRKHRAIVSCPHVLEMLQPIFEAFPDAKIDGELFNYDLRDDFDAIISLVRQENLTEEDLRKTREQVQFWVYDCVGLNFTPSAKFSVRHASLTDELMGWCEPIVQVLSTVLVKDEAHLDQLYEVHLAQGDEGQILRINGPYENKRSAHVIKRKEYEDDEFVVVDITEGDGNRSGQAGRVVIKDKKTGGISESGVRGDKALRIKLLKEREVYIGGEVTIRFNGRTPRGVPRFARALHDKWYPSGRTL